MKKIEEVEFYSSVVKIPTSELLFFIKTHPQLYTHIKHMNRIFRTWKRMSVKILKGTI